jgi:hypothetical protein
MGTKQVDLPLTKTHPLTAFMTKKQSNTMKKVGLAAIPAISSVSLPTLAGFGGALVVTAIKTFAAGTAAALIIAQNLAFVYLLATVIPALIVFVITMAIILITYGVVKKNEKAEAEKPFDLEKSEKAIRDAYRALSNNAKTPESFIKGYNAIMQNKIDNEINKLKKVEAEKDEGNRMSEDQMKDAIQKIKEKKEYALLGDVKKFGSEQKKELKLTYDAHRTAFALENFKGNETVINDNKKLYDAFEKDGKEFQKLSDKITQLNEELIKIPMKVEDPSDASKKIDNPKRAEAQKVINTKTTELQNMKKTVWNKKIVDKSIKKERTACEERVTEIARELSKMIEKFKTANEKADKRTKDKKDLADLQKEIEKIPGKDNTEKKDFVKKAITESEEIDKLKNSINGIYEIDQTSGTHYFDGKSYVELPKDKSGVPQDNKDKNEYSFKNGLKGELKDLDVEVAITKDNKKVVSALSKKELETLKADQTVTDYLKKQKEIEDAETRLKTDEKKFNKDTLGKLKNMKTTKDLKELLKKFDEIEALEKELEKKIV